MIERGEDPTRSRRPLSGGLTSGNISFASFHTAPAMFDGAPGWPGAMSLCSFNMGSSAMFSRFRRRSGWEYRERRKSRRVSIVDCLVGSLPLDPLDGPAVALEPLSEMTAGELRPPRRGCTQISLGSVLGDRLTASSVRTWSRASPSAPAKRHKTKRCRHAGRA